MIYTLTANPSLDCGVSLPALKTGGVNRTDTQIFRAAGKGVNVSITLASLGTQSKAVCLCGDGFVGREFRRLINANPLINPHIIGVRGCDTRLNIKISAGGETSEINGGFSVNAETLAGLDSYLDTLVCGDIIALCGSLPRNVPYGYYADLTRRLNQKNVTVITDTSGGALRKMPESEPFLIKPNAVELGELFNAEIDGFEKAENYAGELLRAGCQNVLVSLGSLGAVLVTREKTYVKRAEKVDAVRTVGAGDALLAGFVSEYIKERDFEKSLDAAVNTGTRFVTGEL